MIRALNHSYPQPLTQMTGYPFFRTTVLMDCSAGLVQAAWVSKLSYPFRDLNSLILIRESAAKEDSPGIRLPTSYSTEHRKGTHNQRLTYPSNRPRSLIGLAGWLHPILLLALPVNHSLLVTCLSLLTPYLLSDVCYLLSCLVSLVTRFSVR